MKKRLNSFLGGEFNLLENVKLKKIYYLDKLF